MSRFVIDEETRKMNKDMFRLMTEFMTDDEKTDILKKSAEKRTKLIKIKAELQLLYEKYLAGQVELDDDEIVSKTLEFTFQDMMDTMEDLRTMSTLAEKIGAE